MNSTIFLKASCVMRSSFLGTPKTAITKNTKKPARVAFSLQAFRALEALRRQREALAHGRRKGNAERQRKAQELRMLIVELAAADMQKGRHPARGRAGRVHKKLPLRPDGEPLVGERLVRKILAAMRDTKFSAMQDECGRSARRTGA